MLGGDCAWISFHDGRQPLVVEMRSRSSERSCCLSSAFRILANAEGHHPSIRARAESAPTAHAAMQKIGSAKLGWGCFRRLRASESHRNLRPDPYRLPWQRPLVRLRVRRLSRGHLRLLSGRAQKFWVVRAAIAHHVVGDLEDVSRSRNNADFPFAFCHNSVG